MTDDWTRQTDESDDPITVNIWHFVAGVFGIGVLTGLAVSKVSDNE